MWRRWDTPQNFFLAFIDELEKQLFIKNLLKWANKKSKNFNINYNAVFKKLKIKKNAWRYHYFAPVYQKSWYNLKFLRFRAWWTEIGNFWIVFCPFTPEKSQFWKIKKNCWRYYHFTHVYQKPQLYDARLLKYRVRQTEFFDISGHFFYLLPL